MAVQTDTDNKSRPFIVKLPGSGSDLYWNSLDAWVTKDRATVYTETGPDLSIGERVYI